MKDIVKDQGRVAMKYFDKDFNIDKYPILQVSHMRRRIVRKVLSVNLPHAALEFPGEHIEKPAGGFPLLILADV